MVIDLFDYVDYRELLRSYFKSLPREGFGQMSKAAKALDMQPSLLTGVLQGSKNLTPEQALDFTEYLQCTDLEKEYFITLVDYDRAGTKRLREYLGKKLTEIRSKSSLLKNRLPPERELPEQIKAQFYSEWYYSAVRMASSLDEVNSADDCAEKLGLNRKLVVKVLEFLIENNLVQRSDGTLRLGPNSTHIGVQELLVTRHHTNWRLKAIEKINQNPERGIHFTSPLSISKDDIPKIEKLLKKSIESVFDIVDPSAPEAVYCLCLDWFGVTQTEIPSTH